MNIVACLLLWVGGVMIGMAISSKYWSRDAVEKGFGKWINDKDGNAEFKWKDEVEYER